MTNPTFSVPQLNKLSVLGLFRSITLQEWITTAVLSAALGVAYWAWTLVYDVTNPFLESFGLKYLTSGLWILGSVFVADLIRKPGIALFASLIAAYVEGVITQWGMSAVIYGLIQGVGAELVFALFLYRNWSLRTLALAAAVSAFFSYSYDYLTNEYASLSIGLNVFQVAVFMISAVVLGACLSRYLSNRLLKTGLLDNFLIGKNKD